MAGTSKPNPPKPIRVWVAANRPFVRKDAANRAAAKRAGELGRPTIVCLIEVDPITFMARRLSAHKVDRKGNVIPLPNDEQLVYRGK